jgi:hypothetical protein
VKRAIALITAVFGVFGLSAQAGQTQRFTLIDRTMVCTTAFGGGVPDRVRTLRVGVTADHGVEPQRYYAAFNLGTGEFSSFAGLVSVESGATSGRQPAVLFNPRRCTRVTTRLRLPLEAQSAQPVEFNAGCKLLDAPTRIVIRLRTVMESPTRWTPYRDRSGSYMRARGKALEAHLAVSTYRGRKPIAFASFARDGSARFFRAPRCTE